MISFHLCSASLDSTNLPCIQNLNLVKKLVIATLHSEEMQY